MLKDVTTNMKVYIHTYIHSYIRTYKHIYTDYYVGPMVNFRADLKHLGWGLIIHSAAISDTGRKPPG